MRLEFNRLTISNFRCFKAPVELELEGSPGLIFIRGRNEVEPRLNSNGAGKSSLLAALCWCLYGQTADGLRNPDLKPWSSSKTPTVTLELAIDGQPRIITRRAVTNGLSIDEEPVHAEAAAELIGLPFEVFINTILQAQGQPLFLDRTPKDKMQLFSEVLNLDRWEGYSEKASDTVKELTTLEAELTGELTGLEAALQQANELLTSTKQLSTEWEAARQDRVKKLREELKEKEALFTQQNKKLADADLIYDGAETEARAARASLPKLQQEATAAASALAVAEQELRSKGIELKRLTQELNTLGEADECPTCGQPIKGTELGKHKRELSKKLKELQTEVKAGVPEKIKLAAESAAVALNKTQAIITAYQQKADDALSKLNYLKPQVASLRTEVLNLKSGKDAGEEERNPHSEQVYVLKRKVQQTETECATLKEDLTKLARRIERTKFWVKGFKDVKLFLIEEVLQELELTANLLLMEVGLEGWAIKFAVEKETKSGTIQRGLNTTILSPTNKDAVKWESFSGGEGQRLRIVGALALSEVLLRYAGVECNLEALDEPTRHLSAGGVAELCAFLADRAEALEKRIFLIDHIAREGSNFAETITVVKEKTGARLEYI